MSIIYSLLGEYMPNNKGKGSMEGEKNVYQCRIKDLNLKQVNQDHPLGDQIGTREEIQYRIIAELPEFFQEIELVEWNYALGESEITNRIHSQKYTHTVSGAVLRRVFLR
jgi:hypothetical protein